MASSARRPSRSQRSRVSGRPAMPSARGRSAMRAAPAKQRRVLDARRRYRRRG